MRRILVRRAQPGYYSLRILALGVLARRESELNRLLTLVHVSDLHFGHVAFDSLDARARRIWALHPAFDGLLGHSGLGLRHLEEFFQSLGAEEPRLVVTGDVTAYGHDAQFESASSFLGATLQQGAQVPVGLNEPSWLKRSVPGNHDHWPGRAWPIGKPTAMLGALYPKERLPLCDDSIHLPNGFRLRFLGVNSDSDVRPHGIRRLMARGAFRSGLEGISQSGDLGPVEEREIRVLLIHHSLVWKHYVLGMAKSSRAALGQFLAAEGIKLVLTGHTHDPSLHPHDIPDQGGTHRVWEARCGTTTQRTDVPYSWSKMAREKRRPLSRMNSLLLHRFFGDRRKLEWRAEAWALTRRGFRLQPVHPRTQVLRDMAKLWP